MVKCIFFVFQVAKPLQSCSYFRTWRTIWHLNQYFMTCVKMAWGCTFLPSAQVYQLSSHWDEHFSPKLGPRPSGGAADSQPSVGDVRPAGAWPAGGSQSASGQKLGPSPPSHTPHQVRRDAAGTLEETAVCFCPLNTQYVWSACEQLCPDKIKYVCQFLYIIRTVWLLLSALQFSLSQISHFVWNITKCFSRGDICLFFFFCFSKFGTSPGACDRLWSKCQRDAVQRLSFHVWSYGFSCSFDYLHLQRTEPLLRSFLLISKGHSILQIWKALWITYFLTCEPQNKATGFLYVGILALVVTADTQLHALMHRKCPSHQPF